MYVCMKETVKSQPQVPLPRFQLLFGCHLHLGNIFFKVDHRYILTTTYCREGVSFLGRDSKVYVPVSIHTSIFIALSARMQPYACFPSP